MRLIVAAAGRARPGPERALWDEYAGRCARIGPPLGFAGPTLREIAEAKGGVGLDRQDRAMLAARPEGFLLVALDEHGHALASTALAERLADWRDAGVPGAVFAIGGADGLGPDVLRAADIRLAFGPATWPHLLVRAMLAEQIYRTLTIIGRHPYHRA